MMRNADEANIHEEEPAQKKQKLNNDQPQQLVIAAPVAVLPPTKALANGVLGSKTNLIQEGDLVIVHVADDDIRPIYVTRGSIVNTRFGNFPHNEFIGKSFGSKLVTSLGLKKGSQGFVFLLRPTPLLWTRSLRHRTQILYHADISLILSNLNIKPGKRVVEAGTGSGSLSHSITRQVLPTGHLFTFEFHEQRYLEAKKEFAANGLSNYVTVTHRDVCEKGFLLPADQSQDSFTVTEHSIDAVFLDLPKPWECIHFAALVLREQGGKVCTFSPCIEQVQRACEKMSELGFVDIKTVEILQKDYKMEKVHIEGSNLLVAGQKEVSGGKSNAPAECYVVANEEMRGHTGYLTFATRFKFAAKKND